MEVVKVLIVPFGIEIGLLLEMHIIEPFGISQNSK